MNRTDPLSESAISNTLSESDLALINAMQLAPRADFVSIGQTLGMAPATVARRWQRLQESRVAWTTVTVGRHHQDRPMTALALITIDQARSESTVAALLDEPEIATVSSLFGEWDLLVDIFVSDIDRLRAYLPALRSIPGVMRVECRLFGSVFAEGGSWELGALDRDRHQRASMRMPPAQVSVDDLDRQIISALSQDGRASWTELAVRCGTSAPTARRRVEQLLRTGAIAIRCEVAERLVVPIVPVTFFAHAPVQDLTKIATAIANTPACRLVASMAGTHNLVATMWFPTVAQVELFERTLASRFPTLVIDERHLHDRSLKRAGHVLDAFARRTRTIPLVAW